MDFFIVHEVPGRIRLRTSTKFNYAFAQNLANRLDSIPDIEGVRVTPRTGSVLLLYATVQARNMACALLASGIKDSTNTTSENLSDNKDKPSLRPLLRYLFVRPLLPLPIRIISAFMTGIPFLKKGFSSILQGKINVDVLDATAIGVSLAMRDYKTVSLLTLLLGFGDALQMWTRKKSLNSLAQSLALDIDTVWIRRGDAELQIPIEKLEKDDLVIVRAGSAIPVDGEVIFGEASVNQASMTGEALGVLREPGASVFAGTVVEEGEIAIRPTKVGDKTRIRNIIHFIEESETLKAGVQGKAERLADAVVPFSFLLAGMVWLITRNPVRAIGVLLVDYSCALKLATPLAILTAMREGVRHGVVVKGGRFLELLNNIDTVVFDKTGTLTESHPHVVDVIPAKGFSRTEVLRIAACLEEHFPHPVARAVVRKAEEENLHHREEHTEVEYIVAHGVATRLHEKKIRIGSRHYIHHDEGIPVECMEEEITSLTNMGHSILYLSIENQLAGLIAIEDPIRKESVQVIQKLRERGIEHIIMLTGDDRRTAAAVAEHLGITEFRAQVLPEDKALVIHELQAQGRTVLMVGDGINDSPALSASAVGVTLRDSADLAREVADIVLMDCDLNRLLTSMDLGQITMKRIHSNFAIIMALNTLFLAGGLFGVLKPGISAMLHNLTTVGVSINAMRPMLPSHLQNHLKS